MTSENETGHSTGIRVGYHRRMVAMMVAVLFQAPIPPPPPVELPVSITRIRQGLTRPATFDPRPLPPFRAIFRVHIEAWKAFETKAWDSRSTVPLFVQPSSPPRHFEFLQSTTPEEVRASTVHPCCDVMPGVTAAANFVKDRIRAAKASRAKREVEEAMRAAGIRR